MKNISRVKTYPTNFYEELYENNVRKVHSVVELLSWDEIVLESIEGIVSGGSIGIDGSSSSRRSLNLSMSNIDRDGQKISNSLTYNKKVRIYIGLDNTTRRFEEDKIIWFNLGTYILTEPSLSHGVDSLSFSCSAQDKMSMFNGVLGGKLSSPVSFSQIINGETVSMTWREIFYNSAVLFGGEDPSKVVVDSVPDYIKQYSQVKHISGLKDKFIHVDANKDTDGERIILRGWHPTTPEKTISFSKGERLYSLRRFGPPDPKFSATNSVEPYIKNTGETITSIFDDIVDELSHTHEFFYTQNGDLMLQPIKTFVNERFNPEKDKEYGYYSYELNMDYFKPNFAGLPFIYDLSNKSTITDFVNNPSWDNIKNDFIVTGKTGQSIEVAIDDKPTVLDIRKWFINLAKDFNADSSEMKFIQKDGIKRECYNPSTNTVPFEYKPAYRGANPVYVEIPLNKIPWQIAHGLKNYYLRNIYGGANHRILPRWGKECESMIFKWNLSVDGKILKPNTGIFNPSLINLGTPWLSGYPIAKLAGTENEDEEFDMDNPIFTEKGDSSFWLYFLDLIDTSATLGKYSIALIGKRVATLSLDKATTLFRVNPKELVVITEKELAMLGGDHVLDELKKVNQGYAVIKDISDQMFLPPDINTRKDAAPYAQMVGKPQENEQLKYLLPLGTGQSLAISVGGKFNGELIENQDMLGEKESTLLITKGNYLHPIDKRVFEMKDNATIPVPFSNENDLSPFAFLAYIENKNSRCHGASGTHTFFAVVKHINKDWYYSYQDSKTKALSWMKFDIDVNKDVLVAVLEQSIYISDDYSSSSGEIDYLSELFTIRNSDMVGMFSADGSIDCFSALRSLMHQHTNLAEVITIKCLPMYHLEPNTLISVNDYLTDIDGIFMITHITLPLDTDGGEMSISAIRVNPRI